MFVAPGGPMVLVGDTSNKVRGSPAIVDTGLRSMYLRGER